MSNCFSLDLGLLKFTNSLLHDTEYVKLVKKQIKDVKEQYAVPIYNKEELRDILLERIPFSPRKSFKNRI
jgi:hypothetical protein